MANDFEEMLKQAMIRRIEEVSKSREERLAEFREEMLREPGGSDTITLNRADFRAAMSRGFSVDASNTDQKEDELKVGRLYALTALLGEDRLKSINNLYAALIEEYLFGPVGGDSPYRVKDPEADDTAEK